MSELNNNSTEVDKKNDKLISMMAAIDAVETIGFDFSDSGLSAAEIEEVCEAIGEVRQECSRRIKRLPSAEPKDNDYSYMGDPWEYFANTKDGDLSETEKQIKFVMWAGYAKGKRAISQINENTISRQAAKDRLTILVNEIEGIFADIRERNVDDSVCGLCEYDCDHGIDGSAFECPGFERDDCFKLKDEYKEEWTDVKALPSAQPDREVGKWIDHSDDGYVECPFCRSATNCDDNIDELHYCFSCGAKMEVEG